MTTAWSSSAGSMAGGAVVFPSGQPSSFTSGRKRGQVSALLDPAGSTWTGLTFGLLPLRLDHVVARHSCDDGSGFASVGRLPGQQDKPSQGAATAGG